MRYILEDIEAEKVLSEMKRRGIAAKQRVRVVVETLEGDLPLVRMVDEGGAFNFLADEPELYSEADIRPS